MAKYFTTQNGLCLTAPLVGAVVAVGIRGEWNGLLFVMFVMALGIFSFNTIVMARDVVLQFLLGVGFYAVAFQGLLGPLDGAFGGIWLLLTLTYTVLQVAFVYLSSVLIRNQSCRAILLPFAVVSWEFFRHHVTKLYDGAGLTFCLLGQAPASDFYLLQSADIGGVWLLSFYCSSLGMAIGLWFVQRISNRFRIGYACTVTLAFIGGYSYGIFCSANRDKVASRDSLLVYVCAQAPRLSQLSAIKDSIEAHNRDASNQVIVVYPETCFRWNANNVPSGEQLAVLQLASIPSVTVVSGVWYPSGNGLYRNACAVVQGGEVKAVVDKLHLAPFVESKPIGTNWLVAAGLVLETATRNVAAVEPIDYSLWENYDLRLIPSVCYDIYFGDTYRRFTDRTVGVSICCMDETFDKTGDFQKLAQVHSRLRAVETRQPMIRSSLGGTSGVTDYDGREIHPSEVQQHYSIFQVKPRYATTLFERWGDWFPMLCCLICVGVVLSCRLFESQENIEPR
ncbi:MAG TPA: hypothetical protein DCF63_16900 [Planctomycetaceae bacterium]|nr:hypothetical protein [Planctomycetaceae bacterium]